MQKVRNFELNSWSDFVYCQRCPKNIFLSTCVPLMPSTAWI